MVTVGACAVKALVSHAGGVPGWALVTGGASQLAIFSISSKSSVSSLSIFLSGEENENLERNQGRYTMETHT